MILSLRTRTQAILEAHHLRLQKALSQHFLVDDHLFHEILKAVSVKKEDCILEIGAGIGLLTELLSEHANQMLALEVDKKLCAILKERFEFSQKVTVICQNVLKFDPAEIYKGTRMKCVGNLPYHLSGSILRWFLTHRACFSELYLMLQKEVAERIVAKPGTKSYGVLSLLYQYHSVPSLLFLIPPNAFLPRPKVDSAFLKVVFKDKAWAPNSLFIPLVKTAFSQRRKTLFNNLKSWKPDQDIPWKKIFALTGIQGNERAEQLSLETFVLLSDLIAQHSVNISSPLTPKKGGFP